MAKLKIDSFSLDGYERQAAEKIRDEWKDAATAENVRECAERLLAAHGITARVLVSLDDMAITNFAQKTTIYTKATMRGNDVFAVIEFDFIAAMQQADAREMVEIFRKAKA